MLQLAVRAAWTKKIDCVQLSKLAMVSASPRPGARSLPTAIARVLPPYWPPLELPVSPARPLDLPLVPPHVVTAAEEAEEESWRDLAPPETPKRGSSSSSAPCTPARKRVGKKAAAAAVARQQKEEANVKGALCRCGTVDTDKFMLQCDGCDVWFHGECVGVSQHQAARARDWRCRSCSKRHDAAKARSQTYCQCRGPWDGHSFMIMCDGPCGGWFHGACVGFKLDSLQRGTEAAFRRYTCPTCTDGQRTATDCLVPSASSSRAPTARPRTVKDARAAEASCKRMRRTAPTSAECVGGKLGTAFADGTGMDVDDNGLTCGLVASSRHSSATAATAAIVTSQPAATQPGGAAAAAGNGTPILDVLTDDCLALILGHLSLSSVLLTIAPACSRLANVAEPAFQRYCQENGWRPQRRVRDHPHAWRLVLRQRACAVCLGSEARFPVRRDVGSTPLFRLCRPCARRDKVQQQVQRHGLEVDAIGENGRALFARQFHMPLFGHANGFSVSLDAQMTTGGL